MVPSCPPAWARLSTALGSSMGTALQCPVSPCVSRGLFPTCLYSLSLLPLPLRIPVTQLTTSQQAYFQNWPPSEMLRLSFRRHDLTCDGSADSQTTMHLGAFCFPQIWLQDFGSASPTPVGSSLPAPSAAWLIPAPASDLSFEAEPLGPASLDLVLRASALCPHSACQPT